MDFLLVKVYFNDISILPPIVHGAFWSSFLDTDTTIVKNHYQVIVNLIPQTTRVGIIEFIVNQDYRWVSVKHGTCPEHPEHPEHARNTRNTPKNKIKCF
jgi:hypothetical protein